MALFKRELAKNTLIVYVVFRAKQVTEIQFFATNLFDTWCPDGDKDLGQTPVRGRMRFRRIFQCDTSRMIVFCYLQMPFIC